MHTAVRTSAAIAAQALAVAAWADGLTVTPKADAAWPRWHTRITLDRADTVLAGEAPRGLDSGLGLRSATVMSDYYFARSTWIPSTQGGFRATGGMFVGSRWDSLASSVPTAGLQGSNWQRRKLYALSGAEAPQGLTATPYVGVGYTALSGRGGWNFSADLGLFSQGMKLGQSVGARQGLDDLLREMRLAPLLRFGVSYSF